jgi:peptide/nickel transport system substrate-binding protein
MTKYPNLIDFAPELAESYQVPDATTWIFNLRRGVRFHNIPPVSGRELKAADVVYSFQRMISESVNASVMAAVDRFEAPDDYTVKITLKQPNADFIWAIQDPRSEIMPREAVEAAGGDLKDGPLIGTGPWMFEQWLPEQVVKLKRNPNYFMGPMPYGDEWQLLTIPDLQTGQAAFRTGQVLNNRTNDQITRILKQGVPNLQIVEGRLLGAASGDRLWMSPQTGPTRDVRVRQGLGKLFNRQQLIATSSSVLVG